MERIETFTRNGKSFIYIDFSNMTTDNEIKQLADEAGAFIRKQPLQSVYTITNVENLRFNPQTKDILTPYTEANKPHVIAGALIGIDGLKGIMAKGIFALSGRKDVKIVSTKEEAIKLLLEK